MHITSIKKTLRNTRRLAEIFSTLTRFGFQQVLIDTGLARLFDLKRDERSHIPSRNLPKAVRVRLVLEALGPTFIKLGQILSTRPDLIPPEWAEEFKKLQDQCTPVAYEKIHEVLLHEFAGRLDSLFAHIDEEPMAAASMAQVHRAKLMTGEDVVIKVIRPGNRQIIEEDTSLIQYLAQIVEQYFSNLGYSPILVAQEFASQMLDEVNLFAEGQATQRLGKYFDEDPNISFPKVYWEATTRGVLTLEEIKGYCLSNIDIQSLSPSARREIVERGTDAVFKQCLQFGFFHADPHPGNIFLKPGNKLCFLDCGLTGRLDKKTADLLIDLIANILRGNIEKLGQVVVELTGADPTILKRRDFRIELQNLADQVQGTELQGIDITRLLKDFFKMMQRFHILCPSDLLLLTKALTVIEGVAEEIDPTFDVLRHVEPQIRKIISSRYSLKAIRTRLMHSMANYLELLETAPSDIHRLLEQIRRSSFTLNFDVKRIEHLADKIDHASRLMGIAMIIAALFVGSSILILADSMTQVHGFLQPLGLIGLSAAGIYALSFLASSLLSKRKK